VLGDSVAQVFTDLHLENGVDFRLEEQVHSILGAPESTASTVVLESGAEIDADLVVVGVGARPNTDIAVTSGLDVDDGIVVDEHLRTTDPAVFAAGDVARAYHPLLGRHIRVEHWANAVHQPVVAARSMMGQHDTYDRLPYFYTDQYDLGMEYVGYAPPGSYDEVVFRGDVARRQFIAFWLSEGRAIAGMSVNTWDVIDDVTAIVRSAAPLDIRRLTDVSVPLSEHHAAAARP
jgi:3-phenylpropionate/trans-cinnamate dioxygenase ferredoxin reductase subunit